MCSCSSSKVHHANKVKCPLCIGKETDEFGEPWKCYHHKFGDEKLKEETKLSMQILMEKMNVELDKVTKESKLVILKTDDPNRRNYFYSVEYEPEDHDEESYFQLLMKELSIRNIQSHESDTMEDMQDKLKEEIIGENKLRDMKIVVENSGNKEGALYSILQGIFCVLHLENAIARKMITLLLIEGMNNAESGKLDCVKNICERFHNKRVEAFTNEIEDLINNKLVGNDINPFSWSVPIEQSRADPTRKVLGTIHLDNTRTRKMMKALDQVVDVCVVDPIRIQKWKYAIKNYKQGLEILLKKSTERYEDSEITAFQEYIDNFFQVWMQLFFSLGALIIYIY